VGEGGTAGEWKEQSVEQGTVRVEKQGGTAVRQGAWNNNRWEEQEHCEHCSGSGMQRVQQWVGGAVAWPVQ
jgi:hypothetical protein